MHHGEAAFQEAKFESSLEKPIEASSLSVPKLGGLRYDEGKNRLDLIPPEWDWELGKVFTAGAKKYPARNWEQGMAYSKVLGPLRRHLNAYLRGVKIDETDGAYHIAKVAWNALALLTYDLRGIGEDDLR